MLSVGCNDDSKPASGDKNNASQDNSEAAMPKMINFSVVAEYPHDAKAFTEGLEYVDGVLYESAGQYEKSDIRKTELQTGKVLQQQKLDAKYFGEGITVLNDKIYQLTYKEKTGFVYDKKTMKLMQTFMFPNAEGWGMTNDGTNIIYSDGTDVIYYMDPATFKQVKTVSVTNQYGPLTNINELEYINGYIYANIWQADVIVKIDPNTGKVVAMADLANLRQQTGIPAPSANEDAPEVMNGIAYDKKGNRIFITGKNWPKLFEIKLDN
ncbi:MAG: glutaminyl-peptide cyclotransferase [Bacteroidetes bacterium]|nr:glutaminyl-peptide cyclotransferase [Bacteroidota bacterium]